MIEDRDEGSREEDVAAHMGPVREGQSFSLSQDEDRGDANGGAGLTEEQVKKIRSMINRLGNKFRKDTNRLERRRKKNKVARKSRRKNRKK